MIILEQEHDDEAVRAAILRRAFSIREDKPQLRPTHGQTELEWLCYELIGTRAEVAARLQFRLPIKLYTENHVTDGDMAGFIEVKGVSRPKDRLLVKVEKMNRQHAYLLMDGTFHPMWHSIGWIRGYELREEWIGRFYDGPENYIVPRSIGPLHPVKELFALVKERQNAP